MEPTCTTIMQSTMHSNEPTDIFLREVAFTLHSITKLSLTVIKWGDYISLRQGTKEAI